MNTVQLANWNYSLWIKITAWIENEIILKLFIYSLHLYYGRSLHHLYIWEEGKMFFLKAVDQMCSHWFLLQLYLARVYSKCKSCRKSYGKDTTISPSLLFLGLCNGNLELLWTKPEKVGNGMFYFLVTVTVLKQRIINSHFTKLTIQRCRDYPVPPSLMIWSLFWTEGSVNWNFLFWYSVDTKLLISSNCSFKDTVHSLSQYHTIPLPLWFFPCQYILPFSS